jgi:hypothetical protein
MNRSGGLVQRRNVAQSNASTAFHDDEWRGLGSDNEESNDVDADSKKMRLTLMEEVLLLGLEDRKVSFNE